MRLVVLESPFAGDVEANVAYARACVLDCLRRGESPIASHLLFTQPGITDDNNPEERTLGIEAGLAWCRVADASVVYTDRGISPGMEIGIRRAIAAGKEIEYRRLPDTSPLTTVAMDHGLRARELREHWNAFCDADPHPNGFIERMEAAGLATLRDVEPADLDEAFAAERGIETGGMVWVLTPLGKEAMEAKS